ncbi:MAG: pyruvate kinase [SAR324 cluster bacterium]|nr:pyruvate kinase [SAR324 cluster bacterium]
MKTKSKILCTLGPSTSEVAQIKEMVQSGMDSVRINFSHGNMENKVKLFSRVREVDPTIAILCDIQGPKIRVGNFPKEGVFLRRGFNTTITTEEVLGNEKRFSISYKKLPEEVQSGDLIFINDGIISLKVESINGTEINCRCITGGMVFSQKGVNLPSTKISLSIPTEKDLVDLEKIAELDPEYLALSFVGSARDVKGIREKLELMGNGKIKLISKIERPVAVKNFDEILEVSDGIMVARGDLGVEIPAEEVPPLQKEMIQKCNIVGKPVIVATQMLESMVKNSVPTRAEVSDVFNAIVDGADAVMLSAETASGDFPLDAVRTMKKVMANADNHVLSTNFPDIASKKESYSEIIGSLACSAAREFINQKQENTKILCLTHSGYTARMVSKNRPPLPIIAVTAEPRTARELHLQWGVQPVLKPESTSTNKQRLRLIKSIRICHNQGILKEDEMVIVVGNFLTLPSRTNMLSILYIQDVLNMESQDQDLTNP